MPHRLLPRMKKKDFEADDDRNRETNKPDRRYHHRPFTPVSSSLSSLSLSSSSSSSSSRAQSGREREREREREFLVRDDDLKMGVTLLPHTRTHTHTQHAY